MAGALWDTIKGFGGKVQRNSRLGNYVGRAAKWGAIGGAAGGAMEWAGGGSFFEGAKNGAFTAAVAGAGYTALKAGGVFKPKHVTGSGFKDFAEGKTSSAGFGLGNSKKRYGAGVLSLGGNKTRTTYAKGVFGHRGV